MSYLRLMHPEAGASDSSESELPQSSNVIFFGANYDESFPIKNLYKALNVVRPDALLVQLSPDLLLQNFEVDNLREMKDDGDTDLL